MWNGFLKTPMTAQQYFIFRKKSRQNQMGLSFDESQCNSSFGTKHSPYSLGLFIGQPQPTSHPIAERKSGQNILVQLNE